MQAQKVEENENLKLAVREEGRKRTYSNRDSDRVDLLCSLPRVQRWAPPTWETDERRKQKLIEKSKKREVRGFREMVTTQVKIRLHYLFFL